MRRRDFYRTCRWHGCGVAAYGDQRHHRRQRHRQGSESALWTTTFAPPTRELESSGASITRKSCCNRASRSKAAGLFAVSRGNAGTYQGHQAAQLARTSNYGQVRARLALSLTPAPPLLLRRKRDRVAPIRASLADHSTHRRAWSECLVR
jgi:hypothetical protein